MKKQDKIKAKAGDIIEISHAELFDKCHAIVLFVSNVQKNCILIGFFNEKNSSDWPNEIDVSKISLLLYCSQASIIDKTWTVVKNIELGDVSLLSSRIIAQDLWILDEEVREAGTIDKKVFPMMGVAGDGALYSSLNAFYKNLDKSKFLMTSIEKTKTLLNYYISHNSSIENKR